jgi:hypothetical protein
MKIKTKRNRNYKRKNTRKKINGGFFGWFNKKNETQNITESNESIVYLDPVKNSNVWGCVYLPPYKSTVEICNRIDEISKALDNGGILTRCKFNDKLQERIKDIIDYSNGFKEGIKTNRETLEKNFVEIQLYILVCRTQFTNRAIGLDVVGSLGSFFFR